MWMSMYIYIRMRIPKHIHKHIHIHLRVYIYVYLYVYVYIHIYIYVDVYSKCIFIGMYINARMPNCPASGQSGTGMKKPNDDGTGPVLICICIYTVHI